MNEKIKNKLLEITEVNDAAKVANRTDPKTGRKARMNAVQKVSYERGLWYLCVRGHNYADIGFVMGQSKQNIQKHMRKAIDNALTNIYAEIEYERRAHYMMYMNMYKEAMHSWELSKKGKTRMSSRSYKLPDGLTDEQEKAIKDEADDKLMTLITRQVEANPMGNPVYLNVAMSALEKAEKLLGMHAQIKADTDWFTQLTKAGIDAEEVFDITVINMQKKVSAGKGLGAEGDYDLNADPNVLTMIDAKFKEIEE